MARELSESDWRRHREMCEELRAICIKAVGECSELAPQARENKDAVGSVEPSVLDASYLQFLEEQVKLAPRGPEWSTRLKIRKKNLSPYVSREIACCRLQFGNDEYSIYVDPVSGKVIHWEYYETPH